MKKILLTILSLSLFTGFGFCVTISPFRFEYDVQHGQSISGKILLTNDEKQSITLYSSNSDFTADGDTGVPKFVDPKDNFKSTYGLSNWISVSQDHITLAPNETREVNFTMKIPNDAEPGGHYGAVFFAAGGGSGQIGVKSRLGVLFLVNVAGDVKIDGKLVSFGIGAFSGNKFVQNDNVTGFPIDFGVRFQNDGNVHIKPQGQITIFDDNGKQLEKIGKKLRVNNQGVSIGEDLVDYIPVNNTDGSVLPASERVFDSVWNGFGYNVLDDQGKQIVKFKNLEEYYADKAAEKKQYLKFWETIRTNNVKRKFTAQLTVSYKGKDGVEKSFNDKKDFYVSYKETVVGLNYFVVGGGVLILLVIIYYFSIGKKASEKKLREKIMREMNNKQED